MRVTVRTFKVERDVGGYIRLEGGAESFGKARVDTDEEDGLVGIFGRDVGDGKGVTLMRRCRDTRSRDKPVRHVLISQQHPP